MDLHDTSMHGVSTLFEPGFGKRAGAGPTQGKGRGGSGLRFSPQLRSLWEMGCGLAAPTILLEPRWQPVFRQNRQGQRPQETAPCAIRALAYFAGVNSPA